MWVLVREMELGKSPLSLSTLSYFSRNCGIWHVHMLIRWDTHPWDGLKTQWEHERQRVVTKNISDCKQIISSNISGFFLRSLNNYPLS